MPSSRGPSDRRAATGGLYYGWRLVGALFMAGFMVYGGGLYSFVLFVPPLTAEFHWSRAATTGLVTAFWLSAPLILAGGFAIRRVGATRLLIAGILIEAVCVALLATVSSFWQMYLLRAAMGFGKVMFAVTLPYAISRWFARHYSLGLGIAWAGWHAGGLVLAPLTGAIIAAYGWRSACGAIALGLVTLGLVPTLLLGRAGSPAELGLGLDGDPLQPTSVTAAITAPGEATEAPAGSLGALLRAPMFWMIALVTVFFYGTYGGLLTHEAAVVEAAGFSPGLAALVLGSTAGFAVLGGLATGWVLDRRSVRAVGVAMHALLIAGAVSLLLAARDHSVLALVAYAACFGITIGGCDIFFVAVIRRRFPAVSIAYGYSAWYFSQILTLLIAGPAAGRMFDLSGSYDRTLTLLAASAVLALLLSLLVMWPAGLERAPPARQ